MSFSSSWSSIKSSATGGHSITVWICHVAHQHQKSTYFASVVQGRMIRSRIATLGQVGTLTLRLVGRGRRGTWENSGEYRAVLRKRGRWSVSLVRLGGLSGAIEPSRVRMRRSYPTLASPPHKKGLWGGTANEFLLNRGWKHCNNVRYLCSWPTDCFCGLRTGRRKFSGVLRSIYWF